MDGWIAAEEDMGQLESLHTCPAGEEAAGPWRRRAGSSPGCSEQPSQEEQLGLSRAPRVPAAQGTPGSLETQLGGAR